MEIFLWMEFCNNDQSQKKLVSLSAILFLQSVVYSGRVRTIKIVSG